jgi:hypothetical protein
MKTLEEWLILQALRNRNLPAMSNYAKCNVVCNSMCFVRMTQGSDLQMCTRVMTDRMSPSKRTWYLV